MNGQDTRAAGAGRVTGLASVRIYSGSEAKRRNAGKPRTMRLLEHLRQAELERGRDRLRCERAVLVCAVAGMAVCVLLAAWWCGGGK